MGERRVRNAKVGSSILLGSTIPGEETTAATILTGGNLTGVCLFVRRGPRHGAEYPMQERPCEADHGNGGKQ